MEVLASSFYKRRPVASVVASSKAYSRSCLAKGFHLVSPLAHLEKLKEETSLPLGHAFSLASLQLNPRLRSHHTASFGYDARERLLQVLPGRRKAIVRPQDLPGKLNHTRLLRTLPSSDDPLALLLAYNAALSRTNLKPKDAPRIGERAPSARGSGTLLEKRTRQLSESSPPAPSTPATRRGRTPAVSAQPALTPLYPRALEEVAKELQHPRLYIKGTLEKLVTNAA
ncbi:hypothetical protein ACLOJK_037118 [Asimina triloba]